MSGLFRRLAQQASGRATTLHAPARLPFHAAPAASEALDTAAADFYAEAPAPTVGSAAPSRATPPHASVGAESSGNTLGTSDVAPSTSGIASAREAAETASALELRGDDDRRDVPPQPTHPAHADQRADPSTRRAHGSVSPQEVPAPIAPSVAAEAPTPQTPATAIPAADTAAPKAYTPTQDGTAPPEFPPALLPPHADATRATPAAASARAPSAERRDDRVHTAAADAPNEVHVHIGRIEVTAIQEAAPKPRAKRNGRAPMSLDEYIAKRQRGTS